MSNAGNQLAERSQPVRLYQLLLQILLLGDVLDDFQNADNIGPILSEHGIEGMTPDFVFPNGFRPRGLLFLYHLMSETVFARLGNAVK
ncbi:MAG: hypothetical protein A4E66_01359 [Syntrophus sp. PtaB.Bin001]|nr:MAG: hypothetical protein A4E66_01359 [Syntrophus sp. PtaB.Bin001]